MQYGGSEELTIRFLDGPSEGSRTIKGVWPPPPEFIVKGHLGRYALDAEYDETRIAEYRWEPAEGEA